MTRLSEIWRSAVQAVTRYPLLGLPGIFAAGMIFWGGFNWSLELTNTESFCVSCHAMKEFLYKEYRSSIHFANRTGVQASCPDCHVPREWVHKVIRKVNATNELFHWIRGSINTPEKFEAKRHTLAKSVWSSMQRTDSRECRNCHHINSMDAKEQTVRSRTMHELAVGWKMTCIECHQGIVHTLPKGYDKELQMDELHDRMEDEKVDCKLCHEGMAGARKDDGWD